MARISNGIAPPWVYPNAAIDLDFCKKRYWGGYVDEKSLSMDNGSFIGDGGAYIGLVPYTLQRNGVLKKGSDSQNRITDLGFYQERGTTNRALWSRDMTNAAWVAVTVTASKNQPAADDSVAANTASSITASGVNGTILQVVTLASGSVIYSAWIKRLVGTGTLSMTCDGSTYTDVTSRINSNTYTLVQIPIQTVTNPTFGFKIGTSADSFAVDFNQAETGTFVLATSKASTPLVTTAVAVSRGNQTGYWAISGGIANGNNGQSICYNILGNGGAFALLTSWTGDVTTSIPNGPFMIASDFTSPVAWSGGIGTGCGVSGTLTANVATNGLLNWNKSCGRITGKGAQWCLNAGALTANATGAANLPSVITTGTHFNILQNGSGIGSDAPVNGFVGRVTFWNKEITDGQMIEYTRLTSEIDPYP